LSQNTAIQPVILSGGAGTRLWPLSRALYPKQLLPLTGERTMIQETALRLAGVDGLAAPLVVCNHEHRFLIAEQLREAGVAPAEILLEPVGRNTAPAVAVAALRVQAQDAGAILLILPADHLIRDPGAFCAALEVAAQAAAAGALVTFGIAPRSPETGYGYIQRGALLDGVGGAFAVARFVEKPSRGAAETLVASGEHFWNSGIFAFRADVFLAELEQHAPAVLSAAREALAAATRDLDFTRLGAEAFARAPSISIDYAVMEKTRRAAVIPVEMGWSDVGSWASLWEEADKDAAGNLLMGDVYAQDVQRSLVRSDGRLLAAIGVSDLIIIDTPDATLVASRARAQDVKTAVEHLEKSGRSEHVTHLRVYRPWGWYQGIDAGPQFQVKRLMLKPGTKLSLQLHRKRAEHWVVVSGQARVTRGRDVFELFPNQSTYIPPETRHRLENPGAEPLYVVEVQSGSYLGEDDIERFDDDYGR
jgi:mannose-1-phosphate guanylyltransferase/mannose-6-phosphate isomerase